MQKHSSPLGSNVGLLVLSILLLNIIPRGFEIYPITCHGFFNMNSLIVSFQSSSFHLISSSVSSREQCCANKTQYAVSKEEQTEQCWHRLQAQPENINNTTYINTLIYSIKFFMIQFHCVNKICCVYFAYFGGVLMITMHRLLPCSALSDLIGLELAVCGVTSPRVIARLLSRVSE